MKFSFIIPHKNRTDLLEILLASIPQADDIEIIVVDDASTAEHRSHLRMLQEDDDRFTLVEISEKETKGAGHARNVGLEYATGEWIFFADSDDYYLPALADLLVAIRQGEYEGIDIVYYRAEGDSETDMWWLDSAVQLFIEKHNDFGLRYCMAVPWIYLVRRSLIELHHIQFDEIRWGNDTMFTCKVGLYANRVTLFNQTVYHWCYVPDSLSNSRSLESCKCRAATNYRLFVCLFV